MSNTYNDDIHIFYPQFDNQYYEEGNAINVAWKWLIEACDSPEDFKKELRALFSTSSGKVHQVAFLIVRVITMRVNNPDYVKAVFEFAKSSAQREMNRIDTIEIIHEILW